jgi:hypothetical protein
MRTAAMRRAISVMPGIHGLLISKEKEGVDGRDIGALRERRSSNG